jgi:hypothetical protein
MAVPLGFNVDAFIRSWPDFENSLSLPVLLRETRADRRMGVATLALVSSRREYWIALGLITGYAQEEDQTLPQVIDDLTSTGEMSSPGMQQILSWAREQPFARQLDEPEIVTSAIYSVGTALRPEALQAAAESGASWEDCWEAHKPDLRGAWECYLGL